MTKILYVFIVFTVIVSNSYSKVSNKKYLIWNEIAQVPAMSGQTERLGVAGAFVGVHNDALIIAGGANYPKPYWQSKKKWHSDIWVLIKKSDGKYKWINGGKLAQPLAYGASVSTPKGVLCMGGNDGGKSYNNVFLLSWDSQKQKIIKKSFPSLPQPCAYGCAALLNNKVYLAGGINGENLKDAMNNFWRLDLSKDKLTWELLPAWPGVPRAFNLTIAQHNGSNNNIYIISGRYAEPDNKNWLLLKDVYAFSPDKYKKDKKSNCWHRCQDVPDCVMAGTGASVGQSHIFVFSGADGSLYKKAMELKEEHPGFPRKAWTYHTITDTWIQAGKTPINQVTTNITKWNGKIILASGEIKPRVRSPKIWKISPAQNSNSFGIINFTAVVIYLASLILMGIYFSRKNKNTEDFFRANKHIPWWAAGCSIFATTLSSLTYMSIPAKSFATNWVYILMNMCIVVIAPFIIYFILPFFRYIDAVSAYEYLEKRFNYLIRLFASLSYMFFQIGRMAIVMFLSALALTAVTPLSIETCIIIMGLLSIVYCTLGGLEAVIWTDTMQTFVLLGGALLSAIVIFYNIDGGITSFMKMGLEDSKFQMINIDWRSSSFASTALWVIIIGGIGQALAVYISDQGVVQRYMAVSSKKRAANAIWTNAVLAFGGSILFFLVGTALYVFYKLNPMELDPTIKTDAIFPLFISTQLPVGFAGIVVAGIFAAAQSTISTSMNSSSTALISDIVRRLNLLQTENAYFLTARIATVVFGSLGTIMALLLAGSNINSMLDSFMEMVGLFAGPISGIFLLGIFTKRANGVGAVIGTAIGIFILILIQKSNIKISFLLYATIGITLSFVFGYFSSLFFGTKTESIDGLTIYTIKNSTKEE